MNSARYTTLVIVALVALRLGCGWLFFREGSKKLDSAKFTSEGFLRDAKGPFAGAYLGMIPDIYGAVRFDYGTTDDIWKYHYNEAAAHFDFDDDQLKQAEDAHKRALAKLKYFLDSTSEEREKNDLEAGRIAAAAGDSSTASVNFRRTWIEKQEKENNSELQGWLRKIDAIWDSYEEDIHDIAREGMYEYDDGTKMSQYDLYGPYPLPTPGDGLVSSTFADSFIPWFTFSVGVLLVLGLFTRVAAVAGSAFLLSVVASQPPFVPAATDTNYQIVLLLGLLVIAAVGAGRWGGLDFFVRWACAKCCGTSNTRNQTQSPKKA